MFNKVLLMGRLVNDVDFKMTTTGIPVARFRIAVNRPYVKAGEERQTDFFNIVAWRNTAEFVSKFFSKGKMIIVDGSIRNNNYTDQNGVTHYSQEIQADNLTFGEAKSASGAPQPFAESSYNTAPSYNNNQSNNVPQTAQSEGAALEIGNLEDFEEIISGDSVCPF